MIMVRDKNFYKMLFGLMGPIVLQNLLQFSVGFVDNLMVGQLSESAISGVYMANQIQTMYQMICIGLGAAAAVLASQYWGKKDASSVKSLLGMSLRTCVVVALILFLVAALFPTAIIRFFTDEPDVIVEGAKYLRIMAFGYLPFGATTVLLALLRSVGDVRIGVILSTIPIFINTSLNWLLIYGNLGFPRLEVRGAAIATIISYVIQFILLLIYLIKKESRLKIRINDLLVKNTELLKDYIKFGLPILFGDIVWGANLIAQSAIIGHLGKAAITSTSIAGVIFSIVGVGVYGIANASSIVIGQTVGAGKYDTAKQYAKTLQVLFLGLGILSGAVLFLIRPIIISLYNIEPDTVKTAKQFLSVLSVTIIGTGYQMSVLTGIVRPGGSTRFVLINDLIHVWLIVIPSALIAAFVFHAPPWVVFACLKSDQVLKCIVAVIAVNKYPWIHRLTRDDDVAAIEST